METTQIEGMFIGANLKSLEKNLLVVLQYVTTGKPFQVPGTVNSSEPTAFGYIAIDQHAHGMGVRPPEIL